MSEQAGNEAYSGIVRYEEEREAASEAREASLLPLNYARSLVTVLLLIDPPHGLRRKNWINRRAKCFQPNGADICLAFIMSSTILILLPMRQIKCLIRAAQFFFELNNE